MMRKIKLQKGLMMGARSKIESSKEAKQSLKKHILDFQDYHKVLPNRRPVYYSILNSLGQRPQYISIKFPRHKQSENAWVCY